MTAQSSPAGTSIAENTRSRWGSVVTRAARIAIVLLIVLASSSGLEAQEPIEVAVGDQVRLTLKPAEGESGDAPTLVGEVVAITPVTLTLRLRPSEQVVSLDIVALATLERSLGPPPRTANTLSLGLYWGTAGAVQMSLLDAEDSVFGSVGRAALVGGVLGVLFGAAQATFAPREEWERVIGSQSPAPVPEVLSFPRVTATGGWGLASREIGSGTGAHAQVGFGLARLTEGMHLRGELSYQSTETSGSPQGCAPGFGSGCATHHDESRRIAVGLTIFRHFARIGERIHVSAPIGVAWINSRVDSEEVYTPGGCFTEPHAPNACDAVRSWNRLESNAISTNLGLRLSGLVAPGFGAFVEVRTHLIGERGNEIAFYLPISVGVQF